MAIFEKKHTKFGTPNASSQKKEGAPFFDVQAKLSVGKTNDQYEKEADKVADKVVSKTKGKQSFFGGNSFFSGNTTPKVQKSSHEDVQKMEGEQEVQEKPLAQSITPVVQLSQDDNEETVQEKCAECEAEENKVQKSPFEEVQTKEDPAKTASGFTESNLSKSKGGGSSMSPDTLHKMETGFGADFSNVRIHTNSTAIQMNKEMGAHAFTNGSNIYFNQGKYEPNSQSGQHLLAHELTHVIQQRGSSPNKIQRACTNDPATAPTTGMSGCSKETSRPQHPNGTIKFSNGAKVLGAGAKATLSGIAAQWHADARNDTIRIDSFSSCDGSASSNWKLSCSRAKAVESELKSPSDGTPGIPATATFSKFAHGETEEFSTSSPDDNRTAQVTLQPTAAGVPGTMPTAGSGDFVINRIPDSTQDKIFFGQGSKALTTDAMLELFLLKFSAPTNVRLIGFTSMEEPSSLALDRASEVKKFLTNAPIPIAVTSATGNPAATATRSDFARARSVEILQGSATPTTLDCAATDSSGNLVNPPTAACSTMDPATLTDFTSALTVANQAMVEAVNASNPAHADFNAPLVQRFFGNSDPATLTTLGANLGRLQTHVAGLPAITQCGGQCDTGGCGSGGVIAYNDGVDSASKMTLCVPVFKGMKLNDQARNLIHESAHGTSPLGGTANPTKGTKDVAYRHERMMFQLSPEDRLRNSDSYALFALFAKEIKTTGNPAAVPANIATPASDNITGITGPDLDAIKLAVAQLEKRASWSASHSGQLFGEAQKVKAGEQVWADTWAEQYMQKAATLFPVNDPSVAPNKPTMDDMTKLAAIVERYKMIKFRTKKPFNISAMASGVVSWPAGSGGLASDTFQVGPDFFRASPEQQISLLLEAQAGATQGVETAFIPAYVEFARWIHENA